MYHMIGCLNDHTCLNGGKTFFFEISMKCVGLSRVFMHVFNLLHLFLLVHCHHSATCVHSWQGGMVLLSTSVSVFTYCSTQKTNFLFNIIVGAIHNTYHFILQ